MRKTPMVAMIVFVFTLCMIGFAQAGGAGRAGFVKKNRAGGVSCGSVSGVRGPNAGTARASGFATDGQGNAAGGSTRVFKGAQGQTGVRAGGFTRSSDGSVQHQSGAAVAGTKGSATTQGSFSKDSQGNVSGQRNTTVSSKSGGEYQGTTTYDSSSGVSHTGTCYDSAGKVVSCPGK